MSYMNNISDAERQASKDLPFHLQINLGGKDDCRVFFTVDGTLKDWIIRGRPRIFYKGSEITDLVDHRRVIREIYSKEEDTVKAVEDQYCLQMEELFYPQAEDDPYVSH